MCIQKLANFLSDEICDIINDISGIKILFCLKTHLFKAFVFTLAIGISKSLLYTESPKKFIQEHL